VGAAPSFKGGKAASRQGGCSKGKKRTGKRAPFQKKGGRVKNRSGLGVDVTLTRGGNRSVSTRERELSLLGTFSRWF